MNNNLRKLLSIAACVTCFGVTPSYNAANAATIDVDSSATADGSTGKITITHNYPWVAGDGNIAEMASGGNLEIKNYTDSVANGILQATTGHLNLTSGTLTVGSGSIIEQTAYVNTSAGTKILINGGSVSLYSTGDNIGGSIQMQSGNFYVNQITIGEQLQVVDGTATVKNATIGGNTYLYKGSTEIRNSQLNSDLGISGIGTHNISGTTVNGKTTINSGNNTFSNVSLSGGLETSGSSINNYEKTQVTGSTTFSGGRNTFTDTTTFNSGLTISNGTNSFSGTTDVKGAAVINGHSTNKFEGTTTFENTVNVSNGTNTFADTTNFNESATFSGGESEFSDNTMFNGAATFSGGQNTFTGSTEFSESIKFTNGTNSFTSGTTKFDKSVTIEGGTNEFGGVNTFSDKTTISGGVNKFTNSAFRDDVTVSAGSNTFTNVNGTKDFKISNGTNTVSNSNFNGNLEITGGTKNQLSGTTVDGTTTISAGKNIFETVNLRNDVTISGGETSMENAILSGKLTIESGKNEFDDVIVYDKLSVENGQNIFKDFTAQDEMVVAGGTNTFDNAVLSTGLNQTGGTTTLKNANYDIKSVTAGTLNIDNRATATLTSGSELSPDVTVNIKSNGELAINGGTAELSSGSLAGQVNLRSGYLTVDGAQKTVTGVYKQSGGSSYFEGGTAFELNNTADSISGGQVSIGTEDKTGKLSVSRGQITNGAQVYINKAGTLEVKGSGSVVLDSNDYWEGKVEVQNGILDIKNVNPHKTASAVLKVNGGEVNISNNFSLDNSQDSFDFGTINVGGAGSSVKLTVNKGTINEEANLNLASGSNLHVRGGNVSLDSEDTLDGDILASGGVLTLNDINKKGTFTQDNGTVTVIGQNFKFDKAGDKIQGGNFNIGDGSSTSLIHVTNGTITEDAAVNIKNHATLSVEGGNVALGPDTTWNGKVTQTDGSLALVGVTKSANGRFNQIDGKTTVTGKTFDLNNDLDSIDGGRLQIGNGASASMMSVSSGAIAKDAEVRITNNATLRINGGNVILDASDEIEGSIQISGGNLDLDNNHKTPAGSFVQTGGTTTVKNIGFDLNSAEDVVSGGVFKIGDNVVTSSVDVSSGKVTNGATVYVNKKASLNITGGDVELDGTDSWLGSIVVSEGNLNLSEVNKNVSGDLLQTGGKVTVQNSEFDLNNSADRIVDGNLVIDNSTLNVTKGTIETDARVNITDKSILNVDGGNVTLDDDDIWVGDVKVLNGNLQIDNVEDRTGTFYQKKGTTTVTGKGFTYTARDSIIGGTLNVGDGTVESDFKVESGTISPRATVNINQRGTLKVDGGTVELGNSGNWQGNVIVTNGALNIQGKNKNSAGTFTQLGGTTTVTDSGFDMNNALDKVADGTLNIGNGLTENGTLAVSKGTIEEKAQVNLYKDSTLNVSGGDVVLDGNNDNYSGTVNVTGGNLALVGIAKDNAAVLKQTNGTTTITGNNFDFNNAFDNVNGGNLNLGSEETQDTITISAGNITQRTKTNIEKGTTVNITGGSLALDNDTDDKFNGNVNVSGGNLYLAGVDKNTASVLTQTAGTTTVTKTGNTLNNELDRISGGNLVVGTSAEVGELSVEEGTITQNAAVTVNKGSSLNVKGGEVTLDGLNDRYNGDVTLSGGTLTLTEGLNKTTTSTSKYVQKDGTLNLEDAQLVLATRDSKITGGTVNIFDGSGLDIKNSGENYSELNSNGGAFSVRRGASYKITDGVVDEASKVTVESTGQLIITGDTTVVTVDGSNDKLDGHVALESGTLNFKNGAQKTTTLNGSYTQIGGISNISGSRLTLNDKTSLISGGEVNVTDGAELNVQNGKKHTSALNVTDAKLNISGSSTYEMQGGKIDKESEVTIASKSKLEINDIDAEVTLNANDKFDGSVELKDGTLYISEDLTKVTNANGQYIQTGGNLRLSSSSLTLADAGSKISGGNVELTDGARLTVSRSAGGITGGNVVIDDTSVLNYLAQKGLVQYTNGNEINIDTSGLINMANGVRQQSYINNLTINNTTGDGVADFTVDLFARGKNGAVTETDTIHANSIQVSQAGTDGTIRISDWNLTGDMFGYDAPIDKSIRLKIFQSDDIGKEVKFAATDKEIFTPVGYYRLNASPLNDGSYTFDLQRLNPQVFRGQVASVSTYMNQLVINDTLFNRAQIRRYGASYDELFKNKTALLDGGTVFERTLRGGGLWSEVYGNFETLKMTRGLGKVRNNAYGFIVGGDFGLRDLKDGWKWMPTAYIAYSGGHQTFKGVGMYENGVQIGAMNSFSRGDFMETALAYVGIFGTDMNVAGRSEDAFNYFLGVASKSAYDWKLNNHFKIQPNLTLAYNMFGKQNWHADFGEMSMSTGFLNGLNVAPGVNFIYQKETWNAYATIAYTWNLFGGADGYAGNIDLPTLRMKHGYLTWGVGMTKQFSDRLMTYGQATIRNIGRTGIICQGGINYKL